MGEIDQKLIALLRQNARLNVADLAHKLGVSRGTVTNRMHRLEDEQVIVGYTVKLRPDAEPEGIRAWMGVLVEGNQTRRVIASLLGEPGGRAARHQRALGPAGGPRGAEPGCAVGDARAHPADRRHPQHRDQSASEDLPLRRRARCPGGAGAARRQK